MAQNSKIRVFWPKNLMFWAFFAHGPTQNFFLAICQRPWSYQHFGTIISKIEQELGVTMICTKNYFIFRLFWEYVINSWIICDKN